jgi:hypothetical protein
LSIQEVVRNARTRKEPDTTWESRSRSICVLETLHRSPTFNQFVENTLDGRNENLVGEISGRRRVLGVLQARRRKSNAEPRRHAGKYPPTLDPQDVVSDTSHVIGKCRKVDVIEETEWFF